MSGRPASANTKHFRRTLSASDVAILAAAGEGDISQGFKNMLDVYRALALRGYTPDIDIDCYLDNNNYKTKV